MAHRFDGGLWDNECPHGMGAQGWCSICLHGPKLRKPPASVGPEKARKPKPKCSVCERKRDSGQPGHRYHRSYRPIMRGQQSRNVEKSPQNFDKPLGWVQVRRVFDATHVDDAGRQVCDECCRGRCSRCRSIDPTVKGSLPRVREEAARGQDVRTMLVGENSSLWAQLTGQSTYSAS